MSSEIHLIINDIKEMISKLSLDKNEGGVIENYNKNIHWHKMGLSCEAISKECTKLAVAFSKPPTPAEQDTKLLMKDVAKAVDVLLAWYKTFPNAEGQTLNRVLQKCIYSIICSVCEFLELIGNCKTTGGKDRLTTTATIWECCHNFKTLPQDNRTAAVTEIDVSYKLVSDAMNEVKETIKEHDTNLLDAIDDNHAIDEEQEEWTKSDRNLIKSCVGMLMASKGLLKKSMFWLNDPNKNINIKETDLLVDVISCMSPKVDDFVMSLYPPLNRNNLIEQAVELQKCVIKVINLIRSSPSFNSELDSWVDFVEKAICHNFNNLNSLMIIF